MTPEQAAALQAGAQVASTSINAIAQSNLNKKQLRWNEQQYALQRQHALQDWNMQNEYNSPTAQMKRLQDAGLNPNLIYGRGTGDMTASPIRQTESKSWNPTAPQVDLPNMLAQYQDYRMRQAQINLINEQIATNKATQQEAASRNILRIIQGDSIDFTTNQKKKLAEISYDYAKESLRGMTISNVARETAIEKTRGEIDTMNLMRQPNYSEVLQRISNLIKQGENIKAQTGVYITQQDLNKHESKIKELQTNLMEKGIYPGDSIFARMATQYLANPEQLNKDVKKLKELVTKPITPQKFGFKVN